MFYDPNDTLTGWVLLCFAGCLNVVILHNFTVLIAKLYLLYAYNLHSIPLSEYIYEDV